MIQIRNVRENRTGDQEWTIQGKCQYCVHNTQDENKESKIYNTVN